MGCRKRSTVHVTPFVFSLLFSEKRGIKNSSSNPSRAVFCNHELHAQNGIVWLLSLSYDGRHTHTLTHAHIHTRPLPLDLLFVGGTKEALLLMHGAKRLGTYTVLCYSKFTRYTTVIGSFYGAHGGGGADAVGCGYNAAPRGSTEPRDDGDTLLTFRWVAWANP